MRKIAYRKIDAFASGSSTGNPAACLYFPVGETLSDAEMLHVARQHKGYVSEVVFCFRPDASTLALRYFSSESEVEFCGHGTIACAYSLISETPDLLARDVVRFQTKAKGELLVFNEIPSRDAVFITAPPPLHIGTALTAADIAPHLSLTEADFAVDRPIDLIDAGLRTLIVPLAALSVEIAVFPDQARLKTFCEDNGIDIVLIHTLETASPDYLCHSRVFAPRFGYLEDPATGSGNSALGHYLHKNNLWDGSPISIEQGGSDRTYNTIHLHLPTPPTLLFGGPAVTRVEGWYHL